MPSRDSPIWLLTAALIFGFPLANWLYWPQVLRSGVLPPEGDSIMIPMVGSVLLAVVASPFLLALATICLRRYNPRTKLFAWRRDRPIRSAVATLMFGGAAIVLAAFAARALTLALPWYEHIITAYVAAVILWLLALRAAVIEQLTEREWDV